MHYEKEVDIDNKLRNYLKIKGVINNMFGPQKNFKRRRTKLYHTPTFPTLLHGTENWTIKARNGNGITETEIKYARKTTGYTETNCKTNRVCKGTRNTPVLDKIQEYRRNWLQHIDSMPRIRLPRIIKNTDKRTEEIRREH